MKSKKIKRVIRLEDIPEWASYGSRKPDDPTRWKTLVSEEANGSKDLWFGLARLLPGEVHLLHYHKRETEIYYVVQGRAKITIDSEEIDTTPGTTIYIEPGTKHEVVNNGQEPLLFLCIFNFPSISSSEWCTRY